MSSSVPVWKGKKRFTAHLFVELWILVEELEGLTDAVIHVPQAGQRRLSLSRGLQDILVDDNQFICRMSLIYRVDEI
jgi:hypothetical protein